MLRRACRAVGAIVCLLLVIGCPRKPVIGVLLPTTGNASNYGESIESGIRLAVSDARERGQMPGDLEVVFADTESKPQQAAMQLSQLASDRGVKLFIAGATSDEARALLPMLERHQVVCLSPSASAPSLTRDSHLFFRIYPSDELEGNTAGKFIFDRLSKGRVLLYVGDNEYVRGFEPEFRRQYEEKLGGAVVARIAVTEPGWEEKGAAKLKELKPEAVYIVGYAEEILEVLRHLKREQFEGFIVTTSAFDSSKVIQEAGPLAEGVVFPLPPFDRASDKEPVRGFVQRYMDTHQRAPDILAAHGYDAMCLAIEVLKLAHPPELAEIKKALRFGIQEYPGVTGPIMFDDFGNVKHYPKMYIVHDGQVVSYERYIESERNRIVRDLQQLLKPGQ